MNNALQTEPPDTRTGTGSSGEQLDPRRWLALAVILVAGFMDLLDTTIVNVAIPTIQRDIRAEYTQIEWIIAAYVLGFAAMLITGGRLGDIYGRKRALLIGIAVFTGASLLCGIATTPEVLIGARAVQGVFAGLMVPQILSIMHATFPPDERGKVFGIFGGVLGTAAVAGVVFGGLITEWDLAGWSWRPIFLLNVPVGLFALVASGILVRESRSPGTARIDLVGSALAITAVLLLVFPLTEGRSHGWPLWAFAMLAGAAAVFIAFAAHQRTRAARHRSPLVTPSLFRSRAFAVGLAVYLLFWITLGGFFLIWTLYLQQGLGWSPIKAGLTSAIFAVFSGVGAATSVEIWIPRFGRWTLVAGALLNGAGFAAYAWAAIHFGPDISSAEMGAPLAVLGVGFGLVVAPMIDVILTDVPAADAGSASGVLNTIQQIGIAVGIALVGVLFFGHLSDNSDRTAAQQIPALESELAYLPDSTTDTIIDGFRACFHDRSSAPDPTVTPVSCQAGQGVDPKVANVLVGSGTTANADNFAGTFGYTLWLGAAIMVVVAVGMFGLPNTRELKPS